MRIAVVGGGIFGSTVAWSLVKANYNVDLFEKELVNAMDGFSKFEQIKKFVLLSRGFMIEKGEMTPKMSIVRKVVQENFKDKIDVLYKGANE